MLVWVLGQMMVYGFGELKQFFLQDTGSSNGSFINGRQLSRSGQASLPFQIYSADIIQFGVEVTESNQNVAHRCIVSSVHLFLPDGEEASPHSDEDPASFSLACPVTSPLPLQEDEVSAPGVYSFELFQLSQYLEEALQREQMLKQKLVKLQWLLGKTQEASEASCQAVMGKDQLSSEIENVKNILQGQSEDGVLELVALQGDTHPYEAAAKDALHRVLQEKMEVCSTLTKVELRLSSAQDTCVRMQHLRERAEQELTELANKYNMAVKLIKDLTHTVKLAERQQQKQLHEHLQEKQELQQLIQSLEEQKQEAQSNRDTKERLTYQRGCFGQFLDEITKGNTLEVLENCLLSNGIAEDSGSVLPEKQKAKLLYGLLQCILEEMTPTQEWSFPPLPESQMDAAELTESDTLCSSADPAHQSTGRMEEKKETEAMNNITLHTEDCGSGALQRNEAKFQSREEELKSRETELQAKEVGLQSREEELQYREVQLQSKEADLQSREAEIQSGEALRVLLREAQDQAASSKSRCVELQDVLERERRGTQLHSAESASQIQSLQARVQKLQEEVHMLCAERDCVVSSAQQEVLLLRGTVEASEREREKERLSLQDNLAAVNTELDRWRCRAAECEQETVSLKGRLQDLVQQSALAEQLQGELQKNYTVLQSECAALHSEKTELQENMQRLEKELRSAQDQVALLSRNVGLLEQTQEVLESKLTEQQEQHQQDCARQKAHLEQATQRIKGLQREYEDTQVGLEQMKDRCCELEREKQEVLQQCRENLRHMEEKVSQYEDTQFELEQMKQKCSELEQEKVSLFEELQQCKQTLKHLQDRASQPSLLPVLGMLVGVVLAVLYWGYSSLW
ncbi:hypothetical protein GJAV_G00191350 [Gymnothorax javanicus]|nr:hypothetical protein GJAV_G00191350 [Gymnothorax javanicus]